MNEIIEKFNLFLEEEKQNCLDREAALKQEERKDEANLCRIEGNIYDIFKTLLLTSVKAVEKQGLSEEESLPEIWKEFQRKAERVPQNWRMSYEKAKEHDDVEKILIEEVKLAAVEKIMVMQAQLCQETELQQEAQKDGL